MRGERGKIGSERAGEVFKTHSLHLSHSLQGLGQGRRQEEGVRMHNRNSFGGDKEYKEPAESRGEEEMGKIDGMTGKGERAQGWRNRATHCSPVPLGQDMIHLDNLGCTHTCASYAPPHQGHVI